MLEWQDILDDTLKILDDEGNVYAWDSSKSEEIGTVTDYSFKVIGKDIELAQICLSKATNHFESFELPDERRQTI